MLAVFLCGLSLMASFPVSAGGTARSEEAEGLIQRQLERAENVEELTAIRELVRRVLADSRYEGHRPDALLQGVDEALTEMIEQKKASKSAKLVELVLFTVSLEREGQRILEAANQAERPVTAAEQLVLDHPLIAPGAPGMTIMGACSYVVLYVKGHEEASPLAMREVLFRVWKDWYSALEGGDSRSRTFCYSM